jgi:hypothetical protein
MSVETLGHDHVVLSDSAKDAIRDQLHRLLANTFFSHSKRFPNFLRFVVEQTLAGDVENIKERTLGIEIFGRDADYDTSSDPIVRVTAAEIRKRLAQYYQDSAHGSELRITLPSGSYVPQFHWPKEGGVAVSPESDPVAVAPVEHAALTASKRRRHSTLVLATVCVAVALLSVGSLLIWQRTHQSAFASFWGPVLATSDPVLVCIADQLEYSVIVLRDAADPSRQVVLKDNLTAIVIDDLNATVKAAGILQSSGKQYTLKGEGATNLDDLRHGPTIFVGAFDNAWTLRLTNPLRYHFGNDADMTQLWIVDSTAPGKPRWLVDRSVQMATNNYRDYAVVARFTDSNTGKLAIIVAGIGRGGTIAAGEFLTDVADLTQLNRAAQAAGNKKNMEVVLSTPIIGGEPGSPKMEAAYFW